MRNKNPRVISGVFHLEECRIVVEKGVVTEVNTYFQRYDGCSIDLEWEMELDKKKYEAMKWFNKTFFNEGNK